MCKTFGQQYKIDDVHVELFLQYLTEQEYFNILRKGNGYVYIQVSNNDKESQIK